jgi:hypothetical protein
VEIPTQLQLVRVGQGQTVMLEEIMVMILFLVLLPQQAAVVAEMELQLIV